VFESAAYSRGHGNEVWERVVIGISRRGIIHAILAESGDNRISTASITTVVLVAYIQGEPSQIRTRIPQ
jgi:hypothetical protein